MNSEKHGPGSLTQLLGQLDHGPAEAVEEARRKIYDALHDMAGAHMRRERADHTLQATVLADEALMQLEALSDASWENRRRFFAYAASVMRHVLVDHAKAVRAKKRGGDRQRQDSSVLLQHFADRPLSDAELLDLHEALEQLGTVDERMARVVEMRVFLGASLREIGRVLEISPTTANLDYRSGLAWLRVRLTSR